MHTIRGTAKSSASRTFARVMMLIVLCCSFILLSACQNNDSSTVFNTSNSEDTTADTSRVPWDYRIVDSTVGDLIGSDMTVLPDNELLPNDGNYATGDKIWTLQYMDAELTTDADKRGDIRLSAWQLIKSYKDEASAKKDLERLKVSVKTDVNLVGVYTTKYKDKTRSFAVLELPSGNRIKQPIDTDMYKTLEKKKKANVILEEVHDFTDYDLAYAKFRGWAK
nr:hypothetical protein [Paenibacillus shirakamiensis]